MQILNIIAVLATSITGQPCAVIDNKIDTAVFATPSGRVVRAFYVDYGDNLGYDRPVPRSAWRATRIAEHTLRHGKPGHKIAVACTR